MRASLLRHLSFVTLIALLVAGAALAATRAPVTVKATHDSTLNTSILVNRSGKTLYHLTTDRGRRVGCTAACASAWPPLIAPKGVTPTAGPGIAKSKLGTVKRPDGRIQVTYAGLTLYRYSGDDNAGQTNGEGIEKIWYAVSPSGELVKSANAPAGGGGYGDPGGGYYPP